MENDSYVTPENLNERPNSDSSSKSHPEITSVKSLKVVAEFK